MEDCSLRSSHLKEKKNVYSPNILADQKLASVLPKKSKQL